MADLYHLTFSWKGNIIFMKGQKINKKVLPKWQSPPPQKKKKKIDGTIGIMMKAVWVYNRL